MALKCAHLRRRSQVKRGALYTCNPLLPDTAGSARHLPGLPVSASSISGGCKNRVGPLQVIDVSDGNIARRGELKMRHGVHCASFLLCTCTAGMGRISPFPRRRNKRARALRSHYSPDWRQVFLTAFFKPSILWFWCSLSSGFLYMP